MPAAKEVCESRLAGAQNGPRLLFVRVITTNIREETVMELRFTEEQQMMRKMVRDFAETEIQPFIEKMEAGEFPRDILKRWLSLV